MANAVVALFRAVGHQQVVQAAGRVSAAVRTTGAAHASTARQVADLRKSMSQSAAVALRAGRIYNLTGSQHLRVFAAHLRRTTPIVDTFARRTSSAFQALGAGLADAGRQIPILGAALERLGPKGAAAATGIGVLAAATAGSFAIGERAVGAFEARDRIRAIGDRFGGRGQGNRDLAFIRELAGQSGQSFEGVAGLMADIRTIDSAIGNEQGFLRGLAALAGETRTPIEALAGAVGNLDALEAIGAPIDARALKQFEKAGVEVAAALKAAGIGDDRLRPGTKKPLSAAEFIDAIARYGQTREGLAGIEGYASTYAGSRNQLSNAAMEAFAAAGEELAPVMRDLAKELKSFAPLIKPLVGIATGPVKLWSKIAEVSNRINDQMTGRPRDDERRPAMRTQAANARAL